MRNRLIILLGLLVGIATNVNLATTQAEDLSAEQLQRYYALTEELRCLVCQNQNIAESNAPLALDLRAQVEQMIREGKTNQQIKSYMTDRYGDFVLYRPPVRQQTLLLWLGPPVILMLGLLIVWALTRKRPVVQVQEQAIDQQRLEDLLDNNPRKASSEDNKQDGEF